MKKLISRPLIGVLALLCSSAGFAFTVTVTPSLPNNISTAAPTAFSVLVSVGPGFPTSGGATVNLSFDATKVAFVSMTTAPGATPTNAAAPFDTVVGTAAILNAFNTGSYVSTGSFNAFVINFITILNASGAANILLSDQGNTISGWFDTIGDPLPGGPQTYTQACVLVGVGGSCPTVPVPVAAWLFGSGLGLLGFVRRRMTV